MGTGDDLDLKGQGTNKLLCKLRGLSHRSHIQAQHQIRRRDISVVFSPNTPIIQFNYRESAGLHFTLSDLRRRRGYPSKLIRELHNRIERRALRVFN
jgi:hypothetical protein